MFVSIPKIEFNSRKFSSNFTMIEPSSTTDIETLNDYCLLEIFSYLDLNDKYQVYQVNKRFQYMITRLWRVKYITRFSFIKEKEDLRLLPNNDAKFDVIKAIAKETKEILFLPSLFLNLLQANSKEIYPNIEVLSIRYTNDDDNCHTKLHLSQLPEICPNLVNLGLVWFEIQIFDRDIFQRMNQLLNLTLIPSLGGGQFELFKQMKLIRSASKSNTLQYLRISVNLFNFAKKEIIHMNSLRMLQLFQVPPENTMMEIAMENLLRTARSANRQIIGLHIKSSLDRVAMENLLREQSEDDAIETSNVDGDEAKKKLLTLHRFSWEQKIRLINDHNHILRWRVIHPRVKHLVKRFLRNSQDLKVIDLSNNKHFHDHEITDLQQQNPNVQIFIDELCDTSAIPFAQIRIDEETITFEFLQNNQ